MGEREGKVAVQEGLAVVRGTSVRGHDTTYAARKSPHHWGIFYGNGGSITASPSAVFNPGGLF